MALLEYFALIRAEISSNLRARATKGNNSSLLISVTPEFSSGENSKHESAINIANLPLSNSSYIAPTTLQTASTPSLRASTIAACDGLGLHRPH
jgi:hypothetical protein